MSGGGWFGRWLKVVGCLCERVLRVVWLKKGIVVFAWSEGG